jgi:hypothetical protein
MFKAGQIQRYTWPVDEEIPEVAITAAANSDAAQSVVMSFEQTSAVLASGAISWRSQQRGLPGCSGA